MAIKTIFKATEYEAIKKRIENLQPNAERLWGKMDSAQMLAHCCIPIEQAIGKTPFIDDSTFLSRTLIRWVVLRKIKQGTFGRNLPTAKSFYVTDAHQFTIEKQRLLEDLAEFYHKGLNGHLMPHPGFGKWSKEQWGQLTHLHLDHHLKQFSA